jgi:hypothetical protein
VFDHRQDDRVAAIRADRFVQRHREERACVGSPGESDIQAGLLRLFSLSTLADRRRRARKARWQGAAEAAWAAVAPVLDAPSPVLPYERGSGGPKQADVLISENGGWHNLGAGTGVI